MKKIELNEPRPIRQMGDALIYISIPKAFTDNGLLEIGREYKITLEEVDVE